MRAQFLVDYAPYREVLEPFYPSADRLRRKFWYRFFLFQMSAPDSAQLSPEDVNRINQETNRFLEDVASGLRKEAGEAAKRFIELVEKGTATKATARAIREMAVRFGNLNFMGDKEMQKALLAVAEKNIDGVVDSSTEDARKVVSLSTQPVEEILAEYKRALVLD